MGQNWNKIWTKKSAMCDEFPNDQKMNCLILKVSGATCTEIQTVIITAGHSNSITSSSGVKAD